MGELHVTTKTEIEIVQLPATECKTLPAKQQKTGGVKQGFPPGFRGRLAHLMPCLGISALRTVRQPMVLFYTREGGALLLWPGQTQAMPELHAPQSAAGSLF